MNKKTMQNDSFNDEYPTIVTFFTKNWEYERYATIMASKCKQFNLNYYIKEEEQRENWLENTKIKTNFLLDTLRTLKRPILWIDADADLKRKPLFFKLPQKLDFMAKLKPKSNTRTWHVGTMFFNYNERILKFLETWNDYCEKNPGSDELALDMIWKDCFERLSIGYSDIPSQYFILESQHDITNAFIIHRASKDASKMEMKRKKLI